MKSIFTLLSICVSIMAWTQNSCITALPVYVGVNNGYEMVGTDQPMPATCLFNTMNQMYGWYYYTATADTAITVTSNLPANVGVDTRISVYSGLCGAMSCLTSNDDDGISPLSEVSFTVEQGNTYYIVFDSYWGDAEETSPVQFEIIEVDPSSGTFITFTTETLPASGYSECIVDMNGDFLDDIVYVNGSTLDVMHQQVDGGFVLTSYNTGPVQNSPSWSIAAGDLDNNGFNDLIYGGGGGASFVWANADGTGYTETHDDNYIFSQRTNAVDINNDGILDAFVCHDVDANVFYISGGSIGDMTWNQGGLGEWGGNYGSVWIDYDNDCDQDLFIAKCGSDNIDQLHRNDGNGVFTSVAATAGIADDSETWSSAWADYDNDGDMDAFIGASSNWNGTHKFYRNNGDGTFTNITAGSGFDNIATVGIENMPADFNNDGWVDVLGLGGVFMINNGDMTFSEAESPFYFGPCGDLNADGYLDFVYGNTVYYNSMTGNNYIALNTIGTESNKNGIGARVTVYSALGTQIRDVRSAQAFSPMQTLNTHFGLGSDTEIDMITICWPSGTEDVINNPEINTVLTVVEGSTIASVKEDIEMSIAVYPNPTEDVLRLKGDGVYNGATYNVFDTRGALVSNGSIQSLSVDVSHLQSGLYFLEVDSHGDKQRASFSKK